jgi:4-aminobutyrate aminotransferase-like enzyme
MKAELTSRLQHNPYVGNVRGKGLLIGIELVENKDTKKPLDAGLVNKVIALCKEKGLIIGKNGATAAGYNNVLAISPPLNLEEEDAVFIVDTVVGELNGITETN